MFLLKFKKGKREIYFKQHNHFLAYDSLMVAPPIWV